jgi:hypothetical protein
VNASDLVEIEAIKQLKARYFRFLDTKQWDEWRGVFTEDFQAEIHGPHPVIRFESRDEMVESNREVLAEASTVHHGHMPEIELTGPDTARGVWAMVDVVELGAGFVGYGHYHEEYRKVDGEWRIARLRLTRLHIEGEGPSAD